MELGTAVDLISPDSLLVVVIRHSYQTCRSFISAGIVVISSQAAAAPVVSTAKPLAAATQPQDKSKARPTSSISAVTRYENEPISTQSFYCYIIIDNDLQ